MANPNQPSRVRSWENSRSASSAATTGSMVAATAVGAASIRLTAAKNRKFAARTDPRARATM